MNHLGESARMGPLLQAEVERQLLADLANYRLLQPDLRIDWTETCGEGHCTRYLDGNLEELSGVGVVTAQGETIADGWMDFVHGGDEFPLFVFWLLLSLKSNGEWQEVKKAPIIPEHIWNRLPDTSKKPCLTQRCYDARWAKDPRVQEWSRRQRNT